MLPALFVKFNTNKTRLSTQAFTQKNNSISTINIEVSVPKDEAIVMTDLEPTSSFKITNYHQLVNVTIEESEPNIVEILDHKNGTFDLKVIKRGIVYLTINASNATKPYKIKVNNGFLKQSNVLYSSDNILVTERGVIKSTFTPPSDTKIQLSSDFTWIFQDIWPSPKQSDILASSRYILATKYGIINTRNGVFILTDIYPTLASDDILLISAEIIVTKKGIFSYKGNAIAHDIFPTVNKSDIITLGGKIVVTTKGVFNTNNTKILSSRFVNNPTKAEIFGVSYYYDVSTITTTKGVFNDKGEQILSPTTVLATSENNNITNRNATNVDNNSENSELSADAFKAVTESYYVTKNHGVFTYSLSGGEKLLDDSSKVIKVNNRSLVTTDGVYSAFSNELKQVPSYSKISLDDFVENTEYSIFLKKCIVWPVYGEDPSLNWDSSQDKLYDWNTDGQWYGQTCISSNIGLFTTIYGAPGRVITYDGEPIKPFRNEIIKLSVCSLLTPVLYYGIGRGNNALGADQYLHSSWTLPIPKVGTPKSPSYTTVIIGSVAALIGVIVAVAIVTSVLIYRNRKRSDRRLEKIMYGIAALITRNDSKKQHLLIANKPKIVTQPLKQKIFLEPKPPQKIKVFKPINPNLNNSTKS